MSFEDARKCKACKRVAMVGLEVCYFHGGATKASKAKSERAKLLTRMQKFVEPITRDDPLADPISGFEWEYRRTVGRIRWYDEQLSALNEDELTWGKTKHETQGGFEGDPNTTFEAKANLIHELQFRERQHLVAMEKIYISAGLQKAKLELQREYVAALDGVIVSTLRALGHDPNDPAIRQVVRDNLLRLPVRGEIEGGRA